MDYITQSFEKVKISFSYRESINHSDILVKLNAHPFNLENIIAKLVMHFFSIFTGLYIFS